MEKKNIINNVAIFVFLGIILISGGLWYQKSQSKSGSMYTFVPVTRGNLTEKVKIQGTVKPAGDVKLAFQLAGKVAKVNAKVGDKVVVGQVLAELANNDVRADMAQTSASVALSRAQLQQLQAGLSLQRIKKAEMLKGARPEELNLAQTQVANAQKSLVDAQLNLSNIKNKADVDYHNTQNNINNLLPDAYSKASDAVNRQTGELYSNAATNPKLVINSVLNSSAALNAEGKRLNSIEAVNKLNGLTTMVGQDFSKAPSAVLEATAALQIVWDYLNSTLVAVNSSIVTSELSQAKLDGYRNNINLAMTAINSAKTSLSGYDQSVLTVKSVNLTSLQTGEIAVTTAQNALNIAQDNLIIKREGATAEQMASQDAVIRQAESAVAMQMAQINAVSASAAKAASQLDKMTIKAPINGQITEFIPKTGEVVTANQPVVSMMTVAKFQIEGYVTEMDLSRVKIDSLALVTLDTYGAGKSYEARVIMIDPAATINKGNATYKVTLEFAKEDVSIKSGMTANLELVSRQASDTLIISESALIKDGGKQYVIVDNGTITGERRSVETGITTFDGLVSILSGLSEQEKVADFGALLNK